VGAGLTQETKQCGYKQAIETLEAIRRRHIWFTFAIEELLG
jgi:hypothetical protein